MGRRAGGRLQPKSAEVQRELSGAVVLWPVVSFSLHALSSSISSHFPEKIIHAIVIGEFIGQDSRNQ